jgi:hypothetical protein
MRIGYACVSGRHQSLDRQVGALRAERVDRLFTEKAIDLLGAGGTLVAAEWGSGDEVDARRYCVSGRRTTMADSKSRLFARLMDEELSKLEKEPDEPVTRGEFLDALRAVHDRAPTEIQEDIYTLAKTLVEALDAGAMTEGGT